MKKRGRVPGLGLVSAGNPGNGSVRVTRPRDFLFYGYYRQPPRPGSPGRKECGSEHIVNDLCVSMQGRSVEMFFFRSHPPRRHRQRAARRIYWSPAHTHVWFCCNPTCVVFQVPQHMCAMQEWVPAVVCAPAYHDGGISQWSFAYVYDAAAWLTMNSGALSAGPSNECVASVDEAARTTGPELVDPILQQPNAGSVCLHLAINVDSKPYQSPSCW